jgi:hypothetical protein
MEGRNLKQIKFLLNNQEKKSEIKRRSIEVEISTTKTAKLLFLGEKREKNGKKKAYRL